MPVAQGPASIPNLSRCHVAFRQEVTAQAVGNLAGINPIILLFRCGDGAQHQRMRHLYLGCVGQQMIIDPAREDRGFHPYAPRLRKSLHPAVQFASRGSDLAFPQDLPARSLDAIADRFLVNIQAYVAHTLHEEPPWLFSESTFSLSSALCTPVLITRLNIQTIRSSGFPPRNAPNSIRRPGRLPGVILGINVAQTVCMSCYVDAKEQLTPNYAHPKQSVSRLIGPDLRPKSVRRRFRYDGDRQELP